MLEQLRGMWFALVGARWSRAAGMALVVGFLIVILGRITLDEVILDLRHRVADATVTKVEPRKNVDFARVEFVDANGVHRTARIQLSWWPDDTQAGDNQRIDYDPSHPSRARRHGAHDPLALWPVAVAIGIALLLGPRGSGRRRVGRREGRRRGAARSLAGPAEHQASTSGEQSRNVRVTERE